MQMPKISCAKSQKENQASNPDALTPKPSDLSSQPYLFPPVARSLMWRAVMPSSLHLWATSWAANMAAYGEDSSRSAFTFIPPVTRQMVSLGQKHSIISFPRVRIISHSSGMAGDEGQLEHASWSLTRLSQFCLHGIHSLVGVQRLKIAKLCINTLQLHTFAFNPPSYSMRQALFSFYIGKHQNLEFE